MGSHKFGIVFCLIVAFACMQADGALSRVCQGVPHAGFIRHPRGCNWYFVCMNGVPFGRPCPEGYNFDVRNGGACDYPQFVNCSACSPHGNLAIRVPGTCDRYIQCVNGTSTELQCSAGQYFDPNEQTCRPQNLVECIPVPTTTAAPTTGKLVFF